MMRLELFVSAKQARGVLRWRSKSGTPWGLCFPELQGRERGQGGIQVEFCRGEVDGNLLPVFAGVLGDHGLQGELSLLALLREP